jgi:hypothetical protein
MVQPWIEAGSEEQGGGFLPGRSKLTHGKVGQLSLAVVAEFLHLGHRPQRAVILTEKGSGERSVTAVDWVFDGELGSDAPSVTQQGARARHDRVGVVHLAAVLFRHIRQPIEVSSSADDRRPVLLLEETADREGAAGRRGEDGEEFPGLDSNSEGTEEGVVENVVLDIA